MNIKMNSQHLHARYLMHELLRMLSKCQLHKCAFDGTLDTFKNDVKEVTYTSVIIMVTWLAPSNAKL